MRPTREQPPGHTVFAYPDAALVRRHGPQGYVDDEHDKPWLRDEFTFRCVYCRCRETWFPDGEAYFGCDHVWPRSRSTGDVSTCDDLVYTCGMCNACKEDFLKRWTSALSPWPSTWKHNPMEPSGHSPAGEKP